MEIKQIVKLIEQEHACFKSISEMKSITVGEHHLLKLFIISLNKIQVVVEGGD